MALTVQLSLAAAVSLGLGRFAFALLLPHMRAALGWSYAQAGAMNTVNALGYLLGAAVTAPIITATGTRRPLAVVLSLVTASLLLSALTASFPLLLVLRLLAGAAGAVAFICGAAISADLSRTSTTVWPTLLIGLYTAGAGIGIALSGLLIPALLALVGGDAWRAGWLALGVIAAASSVAAVAASLRIPAQTSRRAVSARWPARQLAPTLGAYCLFGAGYIAYATFVIALLRQHGAGTVEISGFWTLVGLTAVLASAVWPHLLSRLHGGARLAAVLLVVLAGTATLAATQSLAAALVSAVLFGGSFLAVITAATTLAQDCLHRDHWPAAIAGLTTAFAAGQTIGPFLTGWISDQHGLTTGLLNSTALIAAATLAALQQRAPRPTTAIA